MHELTGSLSNISVDYATGEPVLSIKVTGDAKSLFIMFDELKTVEKLSIKISKYKKKRSLDANAYCWTLISRLSEKLNIPKTDIYRQAIKEIGGNSDYMCVQDRAVQKLRDSWERNGIGWQTDTMPSKLEGCTTVILYYGSSTYDSYQMSRLINIIVDECKQVGIETKSKEELDSLLGQWGCENV